MIIPASKLQEIHVRTIRAKGFLTQQKIVKFFTIIAVLHLVHINVNAKKAGFGTETKKNVLTHAKTNPVKILRMPLNV